MERRGIRRMSMSRVITSLPYCRGWVLMFCFHPPHQAASVSERNFFRHQAEGVSERRFFQHQAASVSERSKTTNREHLSFA